MLLADGDLQATLLTVKLAGVVTAIEQLNQLLLPLFARAPGEAGPNEIDDRPVLL